MTYVAFTTWQVVAVCGAVVGLVVLSYFSGRRHQHALGPRSFLDELNRKTLELREKDVEIRELQSRLAQNEIARADLLDQKRGAILQAHRLEEQIRVATNELVQTTQSQVHRFLEAADAAPESERVIRRRAV